MDEKELIPISANDFYKIVDATSILEAVKYIADKKISLKQSTKYSVIISNEPFPPKEVMRISANLKGYKIDENTLFGGQVNKPFEKLGFSVIGNEDYPFINLNKFQPQISKYNNAIANSDWLKEREIYKFNFINWIQENIDFKNDSIEEIKAKIELSQEQNFTPNSSEKGINFIKRIKQYNDDYITIDDIIKLKKIAFENLPLNKENLSLSFGSFPRTSTYLSLFAPEKFIAYDNESLPAYQFLSENNNPPKKDFRAFQFYQIFYQNIKKLLKESQIDIQKIKEILNVDELTELHWNFIAQDFLLYITRKIMTADTLQKKYDSFIEREKLENWEWYQDIKKYTEAISRIKSNCENDNYSNYSELNEDYRNIIGNNNGDFLERFLFMSSNGFSTIRNQLIKHNVRPKIRQKINDDFSILKGIILETNIHTAFNKIHKLIEANNWTVIYRFLRALFPYDLTAVDAPNHFEVLVKKLDRDFDIKLTQNNQIDKSKDILNRINFDDIYKAQIFFWMYRVENTTNDKKQSEDTEITDMATKFPLNQILYGAPGTGKTYLTKKLAVEIINGEKERNRTEILDEYEALKKLGQIEFTTFHQSMSYEDFVEGIRPEEQNGQIIYEKKSGIFKDLCNTAKATTFEIDSSNIDFEKCDYFKMSLGGLQNLEKHQWALENDLVFLGWGNDKDFTKYNEIKDWNLFRDKFNEEFPELVKESKYVIQAVFIFQKMKTGDVILVSKGNKIIDAIGVVEGDYFYDDSKDIDHYQFRKIKWLAKNLNLNSNVFVNKGISQQAIYQFYNEDINKEVLKEMFTKKNSSEPNKYVLIIDEINRGNVSAIFGELITLLEEDKRKGIFKENKEYIEVILPYSNDKFSVPDNLYIIGTMNTADRSVEALDTALRRRFSFTEMSPKPELLIPQEIIYNTLWEYENIGWDDNGWIKVENGLKEIFAFNEDWEINKKNLWEEFKKNQYNIQDSEKLLPFFKEKVELSTLLSTINERIEYLIDKDHQIGHSYLFKVRSLNDLIEVFRDKILPLLEEYFYGDYGKIGLVLGGKFIQSKTQNSENILAKNFQYNSDILEEKEFYEFVPHNYWDIETFTSVYSVRNKDNEQ